MGKISFIVPLYNDERNIYKCLHSIFLNFAEGDQVIVVDNGSTDGSLDIVKSFSRVIIVERPGKTVSDVRNFGASFASGCFYAFIDSDCVIGKKWRKFVDKCFNDTNISACGAKYSLPEDPCWVERAWYSQKKKKSGAVNYINSGNFIIRKDVFEEMGGFNARLITGEDAEFCARLNLAGYIVWEDPRIEAVHYGNPKNLINFYKQQRWHSLGMLGTFDVCRLDKPLVMTIIHLLFVLLFLVFVLYSWISGNLRFISISFLVFLLIVPVVTSLYRIFHYKNYKFFFQLIVLYFIYYFARMNILIGIIISHFKHKMGMLMSNIIN